MEKGMEKVKKIMKIYYEGEFLNGEINGKRKE